MSRRPLALIVAMSRNRCIGAEGRLPWHLPEDLKHFRRLTTGHAIVMGRRTHESIGRALPDRRNIVVTRQPDYRAAPGCEIAPDLDAALALAYERDQSPFVIGGAELFAATLDRATRIHLTEVPWDVPGDTYFPELDPRAWREVARAPGERVEFVTLERIGG